jgi:hypothetical protein
MWANRYGQSMTNQPFLISFDTQSMQGLQELNPFSHYCGIDFI